MELLPEEIKKNGFIYRLLKRGEKAMLYEQYCIDAEKVVCWEVFKRKIDQPKVIFGIELGEREIFPGNEDFGKWAWAPSDYQRALNIFENIENTISDPNDE
jgi:hypothetical protein